MTYIIAEPCINVKDTACVDVCPVDCIHPTKNEAEEFAKEEKLYIDPEECIDCGACEPVCPVEAIFEEAIYVLHAFQKKTQKTAKHDIEIGRQRYRTAQHRRQAQP